MRACWTAAKKSLPSRPTQRLLSSKSLGKLPAIQNLHPSVRDFAVELGRTQPCYALNPTAVSIFSSPMEFHELILNLIKRAKKRLFLSSLYIGTSEKDLIETMKESLQNSPDLHVFLHLDYNRSTRPGPVSTVSMLAPLIEAYPDRIHAYFFRSPKLKGLTAKIVPRRFDEGWGTWHAKIYGADDEVLISGANLNDSYFTNRQDRYLKFTSPALADYCFSFLRTMRSFCFKLEAGSSYNLIWPSQDLHPQHIERETGRALQSFQDSELQTSLDKLEQNSAPGGNEILIFPVIQAGQFSIHEEEKCMDLLFKHLDRHSETTGVKPMIDFTSGYFSLSEPYQKLLLQSHADCRIICASPQANGFLGSAGLSGRIPEAYTFLEQRFFRAVRRSGRVWKDDHGIELREWANDGGTYHAKGLWVSPRSNTTEKPEAPVLTLFGSTNLNSRSANLDIELAFVMVLPSTEDGECTRRRDWLQKEIDNLRGPSDPWHGGERKVRPGTKVLVNLVGGML